ncbi:MAG: UDP-N-acetylmuramate--L-alanine ligase [bacterium]|nr:UDP-N-acetylmuramate--L-alanine ligase [bacterium]
MIIYFIGIGGIGVSALAQYYLAKGYKVSGSDLVRSEMTDALRKKGARIFIGAHKSSHVPKDASLVVFSPAVAKANPEFREAKKRGVQTQSYPQALGELTRKHYTIAIAGTHGKSTTTAMIGLLLMKAGYDPTIIVGTKLKELKNSNCRVGKSKYLVIEADEHFASFLNYRPQLIVLTSLEADHLDYYKNLGNLLRAFKTFVSRAPLIVGNKDDKNIRNILKGRTGVTWFSLKEQRATKLRKVLKVPGEHNVANALGALTASRVLGIEERIGLKALSQYQGSWRRFEVFRLTKPKPYTLVSDYGHHPTEIAATMQAARAKWLKKKIWLVFQPHQYQRTFYLWKGFVQTLSSVAADKVILSDIYDVAGRETPGIRKKVSSKKLVEAMRRISPVKRRESLSFLGNLSTIQEYLQKNLRGGEVVIVMGAGDIYERLTLHLTRERGKEKMNS